MASSQNNNENLSWILNIHEYTDALWCTTFPTANDYKGVSLSWFVDWWILSYIRRTLGRPCRHPEKFYANEFNAACWSLEQCCVGCVKAKYSHGQTATQKNTTGYKIWWPGFPRLLGGWGERIIFVFFGTITKHGNRCMLVPDLTFSKCCGVLHTLEALGSDSSRTVAFIRTKMVRKVFLWRLVESVICTHVGDGTGTSTQLTHHLFMRSCLRGARRLMIAAPAMR